jgi:hypothetical protein
LVSGRRLQLPQRLGFARMADRKQSLSPGAKLIFKGRKKSKLRPPGAALLWSIYYVIQFRYPASKLMSSQ